MNVPTPSQKNPRFRGRGLSVVLAATLAASTVVLFVPLSGSASPQAAPSNDKPPTISGDAVRGETLVASTGSWSGTSPISFTFQWLRCDDDGADCDEIDGATNTTYVLQDADVGNRIRVRVTATNADGSASVVSDATPVVTAGGAPANSAEPAITGSAVEGQRLNASTGTWTGTQPITFTYQWRRCGADGGRPDASNCTVIGGATSSSYVLVSGDVGFRVRVRVTATNSVGSATAASNPTQTVRAGRAPVNTRRPSVTGTWVEGSVVTLDRGAWTGATSFSQQWLRCNTAGGNCVAIGGATGTQYRLTASDVGRKIRANVTARNSAGATTVISTESAVVAPAGPAGVIVLPSGERSIPVTSVPATERLIVDRVTFTPGLVRSRTQIISVQVRVKDTRGYVIRSAQVFVRSTPLVTRAGQPRRTTSTDGFAVFQMVPRANFPTGRGALQFFVKAYRIGDHPLAGVAGYRLVQVRLAVR